MNSDHQHQSTGTSRYYGAWLNTLFLLMCFGSVCIFSPIRAAETPKNPLSPTSKKLIGHDAYANWRSIQSKVLSRDGLWLAYVLAGQESDGEIVVKNLSDAREWRFPRGTAPAFSYDGKYLAFAITPTRVELDKARRDKKKPEDAPKAGLGVMNLESGKVESLPRVKRFSFPEEGSALLAVLSEPVKEVKDNKEAKKEIKTEEKKTDEADDSIEDQQLATNVVASATAAVKKKEAGTALLIWDISNSQKTKIEEVAEFNWNKKGTLLAYSVSVKETIKNTENPQDKKDEAWQNEKSIQAAESKAESKLELKADTKTVSKPDTINDAKREGVYLYSPENKQARAVLRGNGSYKYLHFDEDGTQLAFLTNANDLARKKLLSIKLTSNNDNQTADKNNEAGNSLYELFLWQQATVKSRLLANAHTIGIPKDWAPSEYGNLSFSKDGQRLFFSTAEIAKPEKKGAPEAMKVDLWHWQDADLQSVQKVNAEKDKQKHYLAVVHLNNGNVIQLAHKNMPQVIVNENARYAMGISSLPYRHLLSWDSLFYDVYAVDLQNGQAKMLIEKTRHLPQLSGAGKYIIDFDVDKSNWFAWTTDLGRKIDLSSHISTHFEDRSRDTPEPKPAYGVAGWTENDASVVLYDQYDLWEINPISKLTRNVTGGFGRKYQIEFRYVYLGDSKRVSEAKILSGDTSWILAATHETKHGSGYYSVDPQQAQALPQRLIFDDKMISGLLKAKESNRVIFTQQSFTEFPDLWRADLNFSELKKISLANPQQAHYNWGTQELIEYKNADGKKLQALLAKPENFDPKKTYPLMVYIYEKMSDNLYRYVPPAPGQNINVSRYVSNGYIVLRPDISYQTGYPGKSAMNSVLPAIKTVLAPGYVDPKRIGIQGHSWGAYQINYLITHSDIFRAAEAGASMANMVSGYGGIRWGAGVSRAFQYERGQSRIGGTPWDSTEKYIENSPIFQVNKVRTPYLTIHNDDDDAVPWYQAIEFFTALRRLNKESYWFNYNGEKHGLRERDNMKHYTVHMSEFFDHYLLGKARPEWMDKPVPYLERGKRDVMPLFVPAVEVLDAKRE